MNEKRFLCSPFLQCPAKHEFPNYFDLIKRPIDIVTIENRIKYKIV